MKDKIHTLINRNKKLINKKLKKYLSNIKSPSSLKKAMRYSVFAGGKRLRPILAIESSRALGGSVKRVLPFACAVELIHNFSLVHDDLPAIDNDNLRRGKPTCHRKFGEAIALLAGDALLNLAFNIVARSRYNKSREINLLLSEAVGTKNMLGGQALDIKYRNKPCNRTLKNKIDKMKTASLMAVSCKIGGLVAGARKKDIKRIHDYGMKLGLAFQIADDIKDSTYKKPILIQMRKKTKSLVLKAKKSIAPFKKKTYTLQYIADLVLERAGK